MKVSIIIATHARPPSLNVLLKSLAPQINPAWHELFIADNGTPAPCPIESDAPPHTHLHDPRPGKCRIQNIAIRQAKGEIIACLDDDLIVAEGYIAAVERFFDEHREFAAMKGRVLAAEDPKGKVGANWPYLDLPIVDEGEETHEVRGVIGANMAFRSTTLSKVGLFDERLGPGAAGHAEEPEICARIRQAGMRIGYAPRAIAYHEVDPARADRGRYLRIARERGRCRILLRPYRRMEVAIELAAAALGLVVRRMMGVSIELRARSERRLEIAIGMWEGLRDHRTPS